MIKWIKSSWLGDCLVLLVVAWLATQLFYLLQIGVWTVVNPGDTAYMRTTAWRLAREQPDLKVQRIWVPYAQISSNLKRAIVASEDANFATNHGVEVDAILQAWKKDQRRGAPVAGGSTISQQLARNLFLSTEKSYLRKGQELIITAMLELVMSKQRIFELYLNSVEWGNGIYGAQAAAQYYYRTNASSLSAMQAARLAVMLPRPHYYDKHRTLPYLLQRSDVIAARMNDVELPGGK